MFAYCNNNPVNMKDSAGAWPTWDNIFSYGKEVVDRLVRNAVNSINPIWAFVAKELHYGSGVRRKSETRFMIPYA